MTLKVGIVGLGYVGGAVRNWFEKEKGLNIFAYDKFKNIGSWEEVNNADVIFVAVPTPFHLGKDGMGGTYDDSAVAEVLAGVSDGKTVIIKSTIVPTSTETFQKKYPHKKILFNPEFLRAKTAVEDFLRPDRQIVGYAREEDKSEAEAVLAILPPAPYSRIMRAREAEMIKYFNNTFLATRVVFANQMYDLCDKLGVDYAYVKDGVSKDERVGDSHFEIFHDGYRGYGGACLPKDVRALLWFAKKNNVAMDLVREVEEGNNRLRKGSKT